MGYYMDNIESKLKIKAEDFDSALKAVKALKGKETIHDSGGAHFSWVDNDFVKAKTLHEAIGCWRWQVDGPDSDITEISFSGQKAGDDKVLFDAIAPYVEAGSFIEMSGEDGARWRWIFNGKTCEEKMGKVVF